MREMEKGQQMRFKINRVYLLFLALITFLIFSSCTHKEDKAGNGNNSTYSPFAVYPSYAGWENVNLVKSLDDGFAVYGCREMVLDNTKVGSVDWEGEDNLEFLGNVGGMGEVVVRNGSYVSGDITYSPEGTYSVEVNSVVKGLTYSWGVTNCPWWDYDSMVAGESFNDYPEYLTISTEVTLATGYYHFKLLDVEGGELYGRGVTIYADELKINGGSIDVGLGLIFSKKFNMSGGKLAGRVYADEITMTGGIVEGKLVGKDVFVRDGEVYYNGDILCKGSVCSFPFEITRKNETRILLSSHFIDVFLPIHGPLTVTDMTRREKIIKKLSLLNYHYCNGYYELNIILFLKGVVYYNFSFYYEGTVTQEESPYNIYSIYRILRGNDIIVGGYAIGDFGGNIYPQYVLPVFYLYPDPVTLLDSRPDLLLKIKEIAEGYGMQFEYEYASSLKPVVILPVPENDFIEGIWSYVPIAMKVWELGIFQEIFFALETGKELLMFRDVK